MKSSGMRTYRLCKMSMGRKENCLFDCIRVNSSSFALFIQIFHNREGVCKGICLFFFFYEIGTCKKNSNIFHVFPAGAN